MTSVARQPDDDAVRQPVVDDLIDALRLFSVESDVFVDVFARSHGLGRSDMNAIMWISAGTDGGRPLTVGELAARLGLSAPATTALVDRLESAGHVRRTRDPGDRRRVTVTVQETALRLALAYFQPLGRHIADNLTDTGTDELRVATEVVRRVIRAVTDARRALD